MLADGGAGASVRAPRGPILVRGFDRSAPQEYRRGDFNPERITLNDAGDPDGTFLPLADVRDRFTAPVRAVVDYSFGNYKFLALNDPPLADGKLKPEVTRTKQRDELAIAGYNVENLDGLDPQDRYDRVAAQIVEQPALAGHPQPRGDPGQRRRRRARRRRPRTSRSRACWRRSTRPAARPTTTARSTRPRTRTAASRTATSASRSCSAPTTATCSSSTGRAGRRRRRPSRSPARRRPAHLQPGPRRSHQRGRGTTAASRWRPSSATAASRCS